VSIQPFAFALADALMGAGPGQPPYKAVAFLLGREGHRRAGAHKPADIHRRTRKFADRVRAKLRRDKGLQYDPLDVVEFNSFSEFIARKPRGAAPWTDIMIVTHGGGEAPQGFTPLITFGKEVFVVDGSGGDLLAAMQAKHTLVDAFRRGFDEAAQITLIACSGPPSGADVAVYMRQLFGTRGLVRFPVKNVDFDKDGRLGTAIDPDDPRITLRPLTDDEWRITPAKDDILGPPPAAPPEDISTDDFFRD
jgi:hypothetical protein